MSIRRMSLGAGYRYLAESVAAGDLQARPAEGLTGYYAASGTPPGRFLGAGLADLGDGQGVEVGSVVSEEQLERMLGALCDPVTGDSVGSTPMLGRGRMPVAGFDLTFSVPKSVSVAWAIADPETKKLIYRCHRQAVAFVLRYAEQHVFHSRSGPQGVNEEDITGVVAVAFTHWDSRCGDPQLHEHAVCWNRAKSVSDGQWRTLDSRSLFHAAVMLSELHQGVLSDLLTGELGVGWERRSRRHSNHSRHELVGVSETLMGEFSQRAGHIETRTAELVNQFAEAHGRQPTSVEAIRLRQRATLETRPKKQRHSLAELTAAWRERAEGQLGGEGEQVAWVASLANRNDLPLLRAGDLEEPILADAARAARLAVASRRATFSRENIAAETLRLLHGVRFATPDDRVQTAERITDLALDASVAIGPDNPGPEVGPCRPAVHRRYTTKEILDAETRLLEASRAAGGAVVSRDVVAEIADRPLPNGLRLSVDQGLAVEQIATSTRPLDVLVGPAGTGKSTTMAALRAVWEKAHGPGSVIGLAPSAAAAEALGIELGTPTENTAKWLTEHRRLPELIATRRRIAASFDTTGPGTQRLRHTLAKLDQQIDARRFHNGQLVIIDEASLAGTLALDELVTAAGHAGAKVLLLGDWAQLGAVEAGGGFGLLVRDRGDLAPQLGEVRRFTNDWEAAASLGLRRGEPAAIALYQAHGRITDGRRDEILEACYQAWKTDTDNGLTSLMIAGDTATVTALNERARAALVASGQVSAGGVDVAHGQSAGVGDVIVTRQNDRRLTTADGPWVKNGDRWQVVDAGADGSLTVQRHDTRGTVTLPPGYVAQHVELGYATTVHQAQGRTVDTAHAIVNPTTTRETLYVAATRGRDQNQLYVDTRWDPDPETGHASTDDVTTPARVLQQVLANQGAEISATESQRSQGVQRTRVANRPSSGPLSEDGHSVRQPAIEL